MEPVRNYISDEPIIRALHRRAGLLAFLCYSGILAWVSFVPFDLTRQPTRPAGAKLFGYLVLSDISLIDIFANIGIYIPFGALGFFAMRSLRCRSMLAAIGAALLACAFSVAVEHAQYFIVSRVASWVDVFCNACGAAIGATITSVFEPVARLILRRFRAAAQRNWWLVVAKGAACALIVIHLRPYDVVVDAGSAAAGLLRADYSPFAAWQSLPGQCEQQIIQGRRDGMQELSRMRGEYLLDRATDAAGYAGLTLLLWLGMRPRRHVERLRAAGAALFVVACTAFFVTILRQFLASHGLDTAHLAAAGGGWLAGTLLSLILLANYTNGAHADAPAAAFRLPRSIGTVAAAIVITAVVAYQLVPFDFNATAARENGFRSQATLLPFIAHFHSRPNDALNDIMGECLIFGAVGLCFAGSLQRRTHRRWRTQFALTVGGAVIVASAFEVAHLFMVSRRADVTTLLIAAFSAAAVSVGFRWLIDYRQFLSVRHADDLLTSQLIEGATYDKDALTSLAKRRADASPTATRESASPE